MGFSELCLTDFEASAARVLPRSLHAFIAAGAEDGRTRDANREAFARYPLLPRMMRDVSGRSTATTVLGKPFAAPFGIAPMGMAGACRFEGDRALMAAAQTAQVPSVLSGAAFAPLEEVARDAPSSWFQAYLSGNPASDAALLERVARAGYEVLVLTLDTPVPPSREASMRAGGLGVPVRPSRRLAADALLHPRWLTGTMLKTLWRHGIPRMANVGAGEGRPITQRPTPTKGPRRDAMTWASLREARELWKGKLVLKGILAPEDAERARAIGADALVVSNHGGRQLDGTVPALLALPAVKHAAGEMPVFLDGGVRRGADVLRALTLGASLVFVGRPFLYALAAHGQGGVDHAIALLHAEFLRAMAIVGCRDVTELGPECLAGG